jgi:gluconate kinase
MKIYILYGEMGMGKNYRGERWAKELGDVFFDGDHVLPASMRKRISAFKLVTPDAIEQYIKFNLAPAILRLAKTQNVVVAQALYLRSHREHLEWLLKGAGHEIKFIPIRVPFWQHMRQLWSRPQGWRWVLFALMNKPFFQH